MRSITVKVAAGAAALVLLAACSSGASTSSPSSSGSPGENKVNVALIAPLTGNAALEGQNAVNAATLAVEHINAAGGPTVTFDKLDDKADNTTSANIASQVVDRFQRGEVQAVVGTAWSSLALADVPLLDAAGVPTLGTTPSSPSISDQKWKHWVRFVQSDSNQASQLSAYAVNNLGKKKVAIIYANNDYGVGIKEYQLKAIDKLGGKVVAVETYTPDQDTDFTTQLTNIRAAGADALILNTGYTEGGLILRQAKQLGMDNVAMIGSGNNLYQDFIKLSNGAAEGSHVLTVFDPSSSDPATKKFVDEYQKRFHSLPAEGAFSTYDAFLAIAGAFKGGATSATLIDKLKSSGFSGAGGSYEWNEVGDVRDKPLAVLEISNGKFVSTGTKVDTKGI